MSNQNLQNKIVKMVKEAKIASQSMVLIKTSVKNAVLRKMAKDLEMPSLY